MRFFYLITCFKVFLSFSLFVFAQHTDTLRVNLISAGILKYNKTINPDYQILHDNVIFEYNNSLLRADLAHIFIIKDFVRCIGNVHILVNDSTHMYGDTLTIDGEKNLARLGGNVQLIDNQLSLKTKEIFYDFNNSVAYYLKEAHIEDPKNYLFSKRGYYYHNTKDIFFKDSVYIKTDDSKIYSDSLLYNILTETISFYGNTKMIKEETTISGQFGWLDVKREKGYLYRNVQVQNNSQKLTCDSLWFDNQIRFMEAFRSVNFFNYNENFFLSGHYLRFFEIDSTFFLTDSALMKIADGPDTLYLHADSIYMINDTLKHFQKIIIANYQCRLWRYDFQAVADSLVHLKTDSVFYFLKNPIIWLDSIQSTADTIYITSRNSKLDSIFFIDNAFIIIHEKEEDYHQLQSNIIKGAFRDNELHVLNAIGNAKSIYYVLDEKKRLIGINISKSDTISIYFSDNQVDKIVLRHLPEGSINPEDILDKSDIFLIGFNWQKEKRPAHPIDVFRNPKTHPYPLNKMNDKITSDSNAYNTDSLYIISTLTEEETKDRITTKKSFKDQEHYKNNDKKSSEKPSSNSGLITVENQHISKFQQKTKKKKKKIKKHIKKL